MDQSKDSNGALPKAVPVEWGAVRALAMVVGVREAARRMQLSEEQVKKRCTREKWLEHPDAKKAVQIAYANRSGSALPVPVSPMSPAALIHAEITNLGGKTRLSLARGLAKAGEHVETLTGEELLDKANDVKAVAQTADLVHGWKEAAPSVKIRLDVLSGASEQPVFDVETEVTSTDSWDNDDLDSY